MNIGAVVFVQIEFRVQDRLALKRNGNGKKLVFVCKKKSRQIQMRQILASFSVFKRYEKFVKTNEFKFWL